MQLPTDLFEFQGPPLSSLFQKEKTDHPLDWSSRLRHWLCPPFSAQSNGDGLLSPYSKLSFGGVPDCLFRGPTLT